MNFTEALKDTAVSLLSKLAMKKLIEMSAFFAWPIVSPIVSFVVTKVASWLIRETFLGLSLLWIILDVSYEVSDVESATAKLKDVIDNPEKYSAEKMQEIEDNFDEQALDLIYISLRTL